MKSDTRILEAEVVFFNADARKNILADDAKSAEPQASKQSIKSDIKQRFRRIKKSMRRRSAGIL